jgi:hypothetical protein
VIKVCEVYPTLGFESRWLLPNGSSGILRITHPGCELGGVHLVTRFHRVTQRQVGQHEHGTHEHHCHEHNYSVASFDCDMRCGRRLYFHAKETAIAAAATAFGPEYGRTVKEMGGQTKSEAEIGMTCGTCPDKATSAKLTHATAEAGFPSKVISKP